MPFHSVSTPSVVAASSGGSAAGINSLERELSLRELCDAQYFHPSCHSHPSQRRLQPAAHSRMAEDAEPTTRKDRTGAEQAKALDSVTDLVPESEKQLDENKVKQAMADLAAAQKADKEAQRKREKELAAVKVSKEDIDVVAEEFELDRKVAERRLRECNGSLSEALKSFL